MEIRKFAVEFMRSNIINDGSGSVLAPQDHPTERTCLPITEHLKGMSGWHKFTEGGRNFNDFCRFSKFTRNRLRNIVFLNCCAFPFSDAKSYSLKKRGGHRVNFLVISDISEKQVWKILLECCHGNC